MRKNIYLILMLTTFLQACVVNLTDEGARIRQIPPEVIPQCEFLGVVEGSEGFAWTMAGDRRNALNKVRNEIASMGGNSYVLTQTSTSPMSSNTKVDAYRCP